MELGVRLDSSLAPLNGLGVFLQNSLHPLDVFFRRPFRSEYRDVRLNQLTQLEDICESSLLLDKEFSQRRDQGLHRQFGDKVSRSGAANNKPLGLKRPERLSHRSAAYPECFRKLPLRRQLIAGFELSFFNELVNLIHDLFVNPCLFNGVKHLFGPMVCWSDQLLSKNWQCLSSGVRN